MQKQPDNAASIEEASLLARSGAGDREAFRLLYSRYSAPLFTLAVRMVGNAGDAEELLQDAFVKIWRNARSYDRSKSRPFTWSVNILRRTCIDHLRKRRRQPVTAPFLVDAADPGRAGAENARQAAETHEDAERLRDALSDVSAGHRRALELALFSEMTHEEIARQLGQPTGTVKSWIRRGLLGLRETLTKASP